MATEQEELRLTVSLVDNASAPLAAMSRQVTTFTSGSTRSQMESFRRSQVDAAAQIKEITGVALGGEKAMLGFIGKFGIAGAAVSSLGYLATAAISSMKEWSKGVVEVAQKSEMLGVSTADYNQMAKQAREAHVPLDALDQSLAALNETAAAFADPSSHMFQRLRELAGPQFQQQFYEMRDAFNEAPNAAQKLLVVRQAIIEFGKSAYEQAKAEGYNEDTRIRRQREAEKTAADALHTRRELVRLGEDFRGATEAQAAAQAEIDKNADALDKKFEKLHQDMGRLFNFWKVGAGGEQGWLSKSLEGTHQRLKELEDDLIAIWGTAAQKAELAERRTREAKERGEPPPEIPSTARAAVDLFVGPTKPQPFTPLDWTNPGTALPELLNRGVDPIARFLADKLQQNIEGKTGAPATAPGAAGRSYLYGPGQDMPGGPLPTEPAPPAPEPPRLTPPAAPPAGPAWYQRLFDYLGSALVSPAHAEGAPPDPRDLADMLGPQGTRGLTRRFTTGDVSRALQEPAPGMVPQLFAGLDEHKAGLDQNTDELKKLNVTLSGTHAELNQMTGPAGERTGVYAPDVPIKPVGTDKQWVDPIVFMSSLLGGAPAFLGAAYRGLGVGTAGGRPPLPAQFAEDARPIRTTREIIERDDRDQQRADLDNTAAGRAMLDRTPPVRVEGSGTLTADINAPPGTRVGVRGQGLFRRVIVNRQTQMSYADVGPPNPGYTPTLENFPL